MRSLRAPFGPCQIFVLGPDSADIDLIIADGDGKIQIGRVPHGEGIRLVVTIISENAAQADLLATWRNSDPLGWAPLAQVSVERHVYGGNDDVHGAELRRDSTSRMTQVTRA